MKEFDLIDQIVSILGEQAFGEWVRVGPGDDCSVIAVSPPVSYTYLTLPTICSV